MEATPTTSSQEFVKFREKKRDKIKAYLLDTFLWSYTFLVCHKVIYEKVIMSIRYPEFSWMTALYTLIFSAVLALILFFIPGYSIGRRVKGLYLPKRFFYKEFYGIFAVLVLLITFVAGIEISQMSIREFLSESGIGGAKKIFIALLHPNFSIFELVLFAAIETIYMAFMATVIALPVAFLLSFFAARNLMIHNKVLFSIYNITRFFLNMTRAIEPLVWAIILSVWVGIGPFAGMLALCLHSVASLAKLYSEQIENINDGPLEAMTATGAHPIQVIWFGVVPQIVLPFLSFTIYRWDINVRMATVIGLVGGGGIGTLLMQYQGLAKWNEVGLIVMVIAVIVWIMDYTSAKIRESIK